VLRKRGFVNLLSRYRKFGIYFFIAIVLVLGVTSIWKHQAIYNQLNSWKLIPRPERLTELYFTDSTKIPSTYSAGQQQTVAFTVHNIEYRTTTYTYQVNQYSQDGKFITLLASSTFQLTQNQSKQLQVPVALVDTGSHSKLEVKLIYDGIIFGSDNPSRETQSIYYWLTQEKLQL
jgi:uncharacterized membrane protein